MSTGSRQRVVIANRADGGVFYWLGKLYLFVALLVGVTLALVAILSYRHFSSRTPPPPDLASYSSIVPGVSRIYAGDGTLLAEFAKEWREVVPYDDIPQPLVYAFLAAEDHRFFEHRGIDFKGIVRAAWANFVSGDFSQGGSTITQQVAKQFLGAEKSLTRKAKEAIVARRLENLYSKPAILSVYLNQIFLGNGAYGVAAAAKRYYSKELAELNLSEMATIAGLAKAPSHYSPTRHPDRAQRRRDHILERMARNGFITEEEAGKWQAEPLTLNPYIEVFPRRLPYFTEHIRRYTIAKYGLEGLMERGLRIETTIQPLVDFAAYENVDFGARKQDHRQGWRGAEAYLEGNARQTFIERATERYGDAPLETGRRYLGLVEQLTSSAATVRVGARSYALPLRNMSWAAKWSPREAINDRLITSVKEALRSGDVIWVSREPRSLERFRDWHIPDGHNPRWLGSKSEEQLRKRHRDLDETVRLEQPPHPQSAILTADHSSGYVVAMVGGYDFNRSEYNRAVQACRQPGSTYKPIYYSAALDVGYGFDTLLNDKPVEEIDLVTGEVWIPTNLGGTVENQVTLEYALVFSKNIPSVAIFKKVGADNVEKWARRLGFTTKIIADRALALGASCTNLDELTRAFAIFARNGRWLDWVYVRRIYDRDDNIVEDNTVFYDPMLTASDRLDRLQATAGVRPEQAIPARAAFLISKLLRRAIQYGFSAIDRLAEIIAAGKTGTSSATMDTSFVGYTSRWITAVWMGDDIRERPLGKDDAAYMTVVPMWTRFMYETARLHPQQEIPWRTPDGVNPKDRGDDKGPQAAAPSPLIYIKAHKPPAAAPAEG